MWKRNSRLMSTMQRHKLCHENSNYGSSKNTGGEKLALDVLGGEQRAGYYGTGSENFVKEVLKKYGVSATSANARETFDMVEEAFKEVAEKSHQGRRSDMSQNAVCLSTGNLKHCLCVMSKKKKTGRCH